MLFRSSVERHRFRMDVSASDIHFTQGCEHPGRPTGSLLGCIVALRSGHVCFFWGETVTGEVAVGSREDVDVISVCAVPSAPLSST